VFCYYCGVTGKSTFEIQRPSEKVFSIKLYHRIYRLRLRLFQSQSRRWFQRRSHFSLTRHNPRRNLFNRRKRSLAWKRLFWSKLLRHSPWCLFFLETLFNLSRRSCRPLTIIKLADVSGSNFLWKNWKAKILHTGPGLQQGCVSCIRVIRSYWVLLWVYLYEQSIKFGPERDPKDESWRRWYTVAVDKRWIVWVGCRTWWRAYCYL
jgi:hypothetical protein